LNTYIYIIAACLLIIFSYLFNILSKRTGVPSVLLLLVSGIAVRESVLYYNTAIPVPPVTVEVFGIIGLIMIVLEAGLDLQVDASKRKLIRNAFLSSIFILAFSAAACSLFLYWYLEEYYLRCLVYAIPLSVVSSAIVIPSISHLQQKKKEFLVYETSFSDIAGIMLFNYIVAGNSLNTGSAFLFAGSLGLSIVLSIVFSLLILFMLTRIKTSVRFFLVFAVLIFLYAGGKMLHLPSLLIILLFGMIVSNWQLPLFKKMYRWVNVQQVNTVSHLLHSLTAESSFLIRTFFFFIFGLTIDVRLLWDKEVVLAGSALILLLLAVRYIYLRFFLKAHIFPELFFMPRGLITVLLFYSIPAVYKLSRFNEGILFFVILVTNIIMMTGSILYGRPKIENINDEEPIIESAVEKEI